MSVFPLACCYGHEVETRYYSMAILGWEGQTRACMQPCMRMQAKQWWTCLQPCVTMFADTCCFHTHLHHNYIQCRPWLGASIAELKIFKCRGPSKPTEVLKVYSWNKLGTLRRAQVDQLQPTKAQVQLDWL